MHVRRDWKTKLTVGSLTAFGLFCVILQSTQMKEWSEYKNLNKECVKDAETTIVLIAPGSVRRIAQSLKGVGRWQAHRRNVKTKITIGGLIAFGGICVFVQGMALKQLDDYRSAHKECMSGFGTLMAFGKLVTPLIVSVWVGCDVLYLRKITRDD